MIIFQLSLNRNDHKAGWRLNVGNGNIKFSGLLIGYCKTKAIVVHVRRAACLFVIKLDDSYNMIHGIL